MESVFIQTKRKDKKRNFVVNPNAKVLGMRAEKIFVTHENVIEHLEYEIERFIDDFCSEITKELNFNEYFRMAFKRSDYDKFGLIRELNGRKRWGRKYVEEYKSDGKGQDWCCQIM